MLLPEAGVTDGPDDSFRHDNLVCRECGGDLIRGSVGLAVIGAPKFTYRVRHLEVSVDLESYICERCGEVRLWAVDTTPIRRARAGLALAERSSWYRPFWRSKLTQSKRVADKNDT